MNLSGKSIRFPPLVRDLIIAAVFEGKALDFSTYWKDVGPQRGFFIEIFEDFNVTEEWLPAQAMKM